MLDISAALYHCFLSPVDFIVRIVYLHRPICQAYISIRHTGCLQDHTAQQRIL